MRSREDFLAVYNQSKSVHYCNGCDFTRTVHPHGFQPCRESLSWSGAAKRNRKCNMYRRTSSADCLAQHDDSGEAFESSGFGKVTSPSQQLQRICSLLDPAGDHLGKRAFRIQTTGNIAKGTEFKLFHHKTGGSLEHNQARYAIRQRAPSFLGLRETSWRLPLSGKAPARRTGSKATHVKIRVMKLS